HDEVDFLWSLPEKVVPLLARLQGATRPLPFVEDVAVPPEVLHDFLVRAQNIFQKHRVTASVYAHAAAGQVHLRPFLPPPTPETHPQVVDLQLRWSRDELWQAASRCNGCGHCRTQAAPSRMCPVFRVDATEEATPRAKANLMRLLAGGQHAPEKLASPEFKS